MMRSRKIRTLAAIALALPVLVACGGGGGSTLPQTAPLPGSTNAPVPRASSSAAPLATATASFSITVPPTIAASSTRRPLYVSPNTQSLTIALTAVNGTTSNAAPLALKIGSGQSGCTQQTTGSLTCAATMTVPAGAYDTFTISTQDAKGNVLSTTTVTQQFTANQTTSVPFTLGGVVASIAMSPSVIHTVQGTGTSSFLVSVTARDDSGAVILGSSLQSPISIMVNNDAQHALLVSQTTITTPGTPVQIRYDGSKTLADGQIVANSGSFSTKADVIPLSFTPSNVSAQMGTGAKQITVSEVNFTGQFTASLDDPAVATTTVTPAGSGSATVTITPAVLGGSSGAATLTIGDGTRSATIPVTISPPAISGITYYPQQSSTFGPTAMTLAPNGKIYVASLSGDIDEFNPTTHAMSSYPVSRSSYGYGTPFSIAADSSNNIWFSWNYFLQSYICEMQVSAAYAISCYPLSSGAAPYGVAVAPDGGVWFTDANYSAPALGRLDPNTHAVTEYTNGMSTSANPYGIVAGKDGNMYFSDTGSTPAFGSISATTPGAITEYTTGLTTYNPQTFQASTPYLLVVGSDGNIWAADPGTAAIDQFIIASHTTVQHANGIQRYGNPWAITSTPGGDLWFTDASLFAPPLLGDVKIGGITQEYGGLPSIATGSINGIVATSPTDLWFYDQTAHAMGHATIP